jgi:DNA primase
VVGHLSLGITEQVRQANDIADVVGSYVALTRAGGSRLKARCPFHQEKTPSFYVNSEKQIFKCFGCGVGGDVFKFVQLREGVDFLEARTILATRAGIAIDEGSRAGGGTSAGPSKADLDRVNRWACAWFQQQLAGPAGRAAREYLQGRKITEESAGRFSLGLAPHSWDAISKAAAQKRIAPELLSAAGLVRKTQDSATGTWQSTDAFRNRLMFPIRDVMNRTVGFGGRTLGDDAAKYVNSPQSPLFDKSRCLYGLDLAKEAFRTTRAAVVVEGYVDCLMAHQHGFGHTVATLGTSLTIEHVRILRRYVDTVLLVFDSDEAGKRAADNALRLFLTERLDVRVANVPEGKDPADFLVARGKEAFERVLTSACHALEFKWKQVLRRYDDATAGPERRRAIEEFLSLVADSADFGSHDAIQRGLILNQVAKLLGLPSEEAHRLLRVVPRPRPAGRASAQEAPPHKAAGSSDGISAAMSDLLGVLLNEPSYFASVESVFEPNLIADREIAQLARAFAEAAREGKYSGLSAFISRFESVETAGVILDIQTAMEQRGNYAATVEGAVRRIQRFHDERRFQQLEAEVRARPESSLAEGAPETRASLPAAGERGTDVASAEPTAAEDAAAAPKTSIAQAFDHAAHLTRGFAGKRHAAATSVGKTRASPSLLPGGPAG